ncbi:PRKR-interacting protein 1 homolog [Macrosteles quadrilineatus]|uniref:PRKR-interacting protein 1 homolog n=2 Tax=Macrosteles quadrilineatus TaxID=74068 RepID=UPI0023E17336|nr:PRKR-interacting protein 1 homolog [Macrosteles quadrilineatus]
MGKGGISSDEDSKPTVAKTPVELQRFKLEKLMKNPKHQSLMCSFTHLKDKPVVIPERVKEKKMPHVPEFVRNVMGSSAGAGSGEFHVYRHLRRKEYARQKFIQEKSEKQLLEEAYHQKLLDNMQAAEERTAKKRAKRLRKKQNYKKNKLLKPKLNNSGQSQTESESEDRSESEADKNREEEEENTVSRNEDISNTEECKQQKNTENTKIRNNSEEDENVETGNGSGEMYCNEKKWMVKKQLNPN